MHGWCFDLDIVVDFHGGTEMMSFQCSRVSSVSKHMHWGSAMFLVLSADGGPEMCGDDLLATSHWFCRLR